MDGERLKEVMHDRGYSQRSLAKKLKLHYNTIYNLVNGHNDPSLDIMIALREGLKLTDEETVAIFFGEKVS